MVYLHSFFPFSLIIFIFNCIIRHYFASVIEFYAFSNIYFQTSKSAFCNNYSVELLKFEKDSHYMRSYETTERTWDLENKTSAENIAAKESALKEAILDVAYYLRRFKFNGHDPRYLKEANAPEKTEIFVEFPTPPLKNIQWEVKKYCESSFYECVMYLHEKINRAILSRNLDSLTLAKENNWSFDKDENYIKAADVECVKLLVLDESSFNLFAGPIQKFQWMTSALYYMCFYTMKEIHYLKFFHDRCDNYASCIDWNFGLYNNDVRGDDNVPFSCASYSFCPDPCCPLKHLKNSLSCFLNSPCSRTSGPEKNCQFIRQNNNYFDSLILNNWNVSCSCEQSGFRWDSKSGICVDIDECKENESICNSPSETCKNFPGYYKCVCNPLGYRENVESKKCEYDPVAQKIFYPVNSLKNYTDTDALPNEHFAFLNKFKNVISDVVFNENFSFV